MWRLYRGEAMKNLFYHLVKPIYQIPFRLLYFPEIVGKENIPKEGPVIIAANHKMAFDPLGILIATKREVHYLAKSELFHGVLGFGLKKVGMIPVYRDRSNTSATLKAEEILKQGGIIGIFPEGKRNYTKEVLLPFHKGTVKMAKTVHCTIVPCAIKGEYRLFRKGIRFLFGKPIHIENMEMEEANQYLQDEIRRLLEK